MVADDDMSTRLTRRGALFEMPFAVIILSMAESSIYDSMLMKVNNGRWLFAVISKHGRLHREA